ncbi:MAG: four helix bundle protein [Candidatus Kryptoniota bacterium]
MKLRFQDLQIWQFAIEVSDELLDIADQLGQKKFFRFAEQLRGAAMSMSNNIDEGSGSTSNKDFVIFLNKARKSTFENANILIILCRRKLIADNQLNDLLDKLDRECRMITNFKKTL